MAVTEIESPFHTGKTKALCFDTESYLIIGNIPGAKCFCAKDKLDVKTCMITGNIQETSKITNENSIHTTPVESRNGIHHLEINTEYDLHEVNIPFNGLSK